MKLGEKIRYLREVEGSLRGLNRAMSQQELVRAINAETDSKISQSYLSQIESGARPHLTNTTRQIPGAIFQGASGIPRGRSGRLSPGTDQRPAQCAGRQAGPVGSSRARSGSRRDPELKSALLTLAQHERTRDCLLLLEAILETPGLMPRLAEVLVKQGSTGTKGTKKQGVGSRE